EIHVALLAGTVAWRALGDLAHAGGYFERLRERAPDSRLVTEFDDLLVERGNPEPIGDAQRALIESARRIAAENPERGIEAWKQAIAAEPERRAPRRALARLLRATERWRALAEALKDEEAQACRTVEERVSVLGELVAVYRDRLHHDLSTAATLERIVELKPASPRALDALAAHYETLRRWPEVLGALDRKLAIIGGGGAGGGAGARDVAALRSRKARIFLDRLSREPEAIRELEAVLEAAPDDAEAASELRRLHEKRHEWDKLVALERRWLERIADAGERLRGLEALAELAQEKARRALAAECWRAVLALDENHQRALAALEQLYEREQDWPRLADVYARQAVHAAETPAKVERLQQLALLYTRRLDDPERAVEAWHTLLALEPGHPRAQDALKRFYLERKLWPELEALYASQGQLDECVRVLERQIDLETEAARVELWGRIAIIYRDRLGKPERAVRAFEKALALDGKQLAAAEALIPFYEQSKDQKRLAEVLEVQLDHTRDASARLTRTRRLAELCEHGLRDARAAFRWWLRAFAEDPESDDARASAERLAAETKSWAELVAAYREACAKRPGSTEILPLLAVVARAEEVELREVGAAIASFSAVLAIAPSDRAALSALERLYFAERRYDELQEIYRRKLELAADGAARREVQYQIARLAEEQGDDDRAAAAYQAILETGGDASPELEALDRIYQRRAAWRPLADVLERRLQLDGVRADKLPVELRLAQLEETHLGDAARAVALYRGMLEIDPEHAEARAALERRLLDREFELEAAAILEPIYERRGELERLVAAREVQVTHAGSDERRVQLLHGIAELLERKLGRAPDAFAALARALRLDPSRRATFDQLDRLAEATSSWEPLAQLYKEIAARPLALADQVSVRCRLGRVYQKLGELKRAIATYTRVLDLDGANSEAQEALARMEAMT
ncbi:MAG TPA: tetratricopeptide repeat protein, partial [Polyangia bacterium]|nr:tetratricopeptide repeat protein [Polyangia bacterium]